MATASEVEKLTTNFVTASSSEFAKMREGLQAAKNSIEQAKNIDQIIEQKEERSWQTWQEYVKGKISSSHNKNSAMQG